MHESIFFFAFVDELEKQALLGGKPSLSTLVQTGKITPGARRKGLKAAKKLRRSGEFAEARWTAAAAKDDPNLRPALGGLTDLPPGERFGEYQRRRFPASHEQARREAVRGKQQARA
jgi:hypothetical protein